jgi:hypothetical protein
VAAQPRELLPRLSSVDGLEQRGVLGSGVHGVGFGERRLEVPDALELLRMRRPVAPLMHRDTPSYSNLLPMVPTSAAVARTLHDLAEPAARLRCVNPVGIDRRSLHVVDLPPPKWGPLTSHLARLPSEVRTNAPLRAPTSTRTPSFQAPPSFKDKS